MKNKKTKKRRKLLNKNIRLAAGLVIIAGLAYGAHVCITNVLDKRASYPQRIFVEQAQRFLESGYAPVHVLPFTPADVRGDDYWMQVTDLDNDVVNSTALDAEGVYSLPLDFFLSNLKEEPQAINDTTLVLDDGTRVAVTVGLYSSEVSSGFIAAGKNRADIDAKADKLTTVLIVLWLLGSTAFVVVNRKSKRGRN